MIHHDLNYFDSIVTSCPTVWHPRQARGPQVEVDDVSWAKRGGMQRLAWLAIARACATWYQNLIKKLDDRIHRDEAAKNFQCKNASWVKGEE